LYAIYPIKSLNVGIVVEKLFYDEDYHEYLVFNEPPLKHIDVILVALIFKEIGKTSSGRDDLPLTRGHGVVFLPLLGILNRCL